MRDMFGKVLTHWRVRMVLPHVRGKLLDVGCGLNLLVRRYGQGAGVDVYPWGDIDVLVDNAASLPFCDGAFDTVTIIAALNHIPDRIGALREAWRVLRPGGRLIVTMIPPGIARFWHWLRKPWDADQKERGMAEGERYGLRQEEVRQLLTGSGFAPCEEHRFMLGINCLTIAEKVARQEPGQQPI